ncbi:MAG: uroporphyrinogen decarboxylase family protein [Actinomycetota bacterium]
MNLLDRVMSSSSRIVAPLAGYPGIKLIGRSVREALHDAKIQLEALRALEERLWPDIVFTLLDLTVEAESMGLSVDFYERMPPSLAQQRLPKLERFYELGLPDPERATRMPVFLEVAEGLAAGGDRMSAAYATGPFTLLAQLLGMEELLGRVRQGESLTEPLAFATSVVGEYAAALAARVDLIALVDPAAEALRAEEYGSLCRPYVSGLAGIIRSSGALCLLHVCGDVTHLLEELALTGAEGICLDSGVNLQREIVRIPANIVVLGNIDPRRVMQRGTAEDVRWEVRRLLRNMKNVRNFALSTGCDVPVDTPMRNLEAMMEEARAWKPHGSLS